MSNKEDFEKMKVAELKSACKDLGLDVGGVKADLVARLHKALDSSSEEKDTTATDATLPAAATEAEAETIAGAAPVEQLTVVDAVETPAVEVSHSKHPKIMFIGKPSTGTEASKAAAVVAVPQPVVVKVVAAEVSKPEAGGVLTEAQRKQQRADRFKSSTAASTVASAKPTAGSAGGADGGIMKVRAARFNLAHPELEAEKVAKRAEKFNVAKPAAAESEKSNKRAAKFAPTPTLMSAEEEIKKKARMERFKTADGSSSAAPAAAAEAPVAAAPAAVAVPVKVMTPEMAAQEAKRLARAVKFAPAPLTA